MPLTPTQPLENVGQDLHLLHRCINIRPREFPVTSSTPSQQVVSYATSIITNFAPPQAKNSCRQTVFSPQRTPILHHLAAGLLWGYCLGKRRGSPSEEVAVRSRGLCVLYGSGVGASDRSYSGPSAPLISLSIPIVCCPLTSYRYARYSLSDAAYTCWRRRIFTTTSIADSVEEVHLRDQEQKEAGSVGGPCGEGGGGAG